MAVSARRRYQGKSLPRCPEDESLPLSSLILFPPEGEQAPTPSVSVKVEEATPPPVLHMPKEQQNEAVYGWEHPAELKYITPNLTPSEIIFYLISNSFSIPARTSGKAGNPPFFVVTGLTGQKTILPVGYRIPLLFLAHFQWDSLKLVLTASSRESEWSDYKFGILHVCRLCTVLLNAAQDEVQIINDDGISRGIDRKWRCPTFDRALARYRLRWFLSTPSQVEEFWETYQEDEYNKDPLRFDWRRWSIKGHCGFALTEVEINDGMTAKQFMSGLKQKNDDWFWVTDEDPVPDGVDAWSLRDLALGASAMLSSSQEDIMKSRSSAPIPAPVAENPSSTSSSIAASKPSVAPPSLRPKTSLTPAQIPMTPSNAGPHNFPWNVDPPFLDIAAITGSNNHRSSMNDHPVHPISPSPTSPSHTPLGSIGISSASVDSLSALPPKTIPQKRPGSPLEKISNPSLESVDFSSTRSRPAPISVLTTDAEFPHQFRDAELRGLRAIQVNTRARLPSSVPPTLGPTENSAPLSSTHISRSEDLTLKVADSMVIDSHTPDLLHESISETPDSSLLIPRSPSDIPSDIPSSSSAETLSSSEIQCIPPNDSMSVPLHPPLAALPESISPEAMVQVVDSIFGGFAESLRRFSNEIRQAKVEGVAEIRESVSGPPALVQVVRDVVREEVRMGMQEELASVKNDILQDNKRELRDGVRVVVAAMREELVQDMQGNFRELRAGMDQLEIQNSDINQRLRSFRSELGSGRRTPRRTNRSMLAGDLPVPVFIHPLRHLLGEPVDNLSGSESHDDLDLSAGSVSDMQWECATSANQDDDGEEDGEEVTSPPSSENGVVPIKSRRKLHD